MMITNSTNPRNLLFLGDSITDAEHLWVEQRNRLGNGFVCRISEQLENTEYHCINKGQDGFTSKALLQLVRREVLPENLAAVTILIGVNDLSIWRYRDEGWIREEFLPNINEILRELRSVCESTIILAEPFLFTRPAELLTMRSGLTAIHQILMEAAELWQCDYLPLQEKFQDLEKEYGTDIVSLDGIHLTEFGNKRLAAWWMECFRATMKEKQVDGNGEEACP